MPSTPLTRGQTSSFVRLILVGLIVQLAVIGYVAYSSYIGRRDVATASRAGCERNKLDRVANAKGWRTAETARLNSVSETTGISVENVRKLLKSKPSPSDLPDLTAARHYDRIAKGLEARSRISCSKAFPKAGLFP